jgi:hypothetical protein
MRKWTVKFKVGGQNCYDYQEASDAAQAVELWWERVMAYHYCDFKVDGGTMRVRTDFIAFAEVSR